MKRQEDFPESKAEASAEASCSVTRGATGRTTDFLTQEQQSTDLLVRDWLSCNTERSFNSHAAHELFLSALGEAPQLQDPIIVYRGRPISPDKVASLTRTDFGPPPADKAAAGRYNHAGSPALYLATTPAGVCAELAGRDIGSSLYCQQYQIDPNQLQVLDMSALSLKDIVRIVFDYTEHSSAPGGSLHSRLLASAISALGHDGMIVPGVRGSRQNRYSNLVVFEPSERWRDWVSGNADPLFLGIIAG